MRSAKGAVFSPRLSHAWLTDALRGWNVGAPAGLTLGIWAAATLTRPVNDEQEVTVRPGAARGYLSTDPASRVAPAGRQAGGDLPTPLPPRGRVLEAAIRGLEPAAEVGLDLGDAAPWRSDRRLTGRLGERLALEQPGRLLGHSGGLAREAFRLLGRRGDSRQEHQHRHQRGPDRATRHVPVRCAAIKETEDGQADAPTRNDGSRLDGCVNGFSSTTMTSVSPRRRLDDPLTPRARLCRTTLRGGQHPLRARRAGAGRWRSTQGHAPFGAPRCVGQAPFRHLSRKGLHVAYLRGQPRERRGSGQGRQCAIIWSVTFVVTYLRAGSDADPDALPVNVMHDLHLAVAPRGRLLRVEEHARLAADEALAGLATNARTSLCVTGSAPPRGPGRRAGAVAPTAQRRDYTAKRKWTMSRGRSRKS